MAVAAIVTPEVRAESSERVAELLPFMRPSAQSSAALEAEHAALEAERAELETPAWDAPETEPDRPPLPARDTPSPAQARLLRLPIARARPRRAEAPSWSLETLSGRLVELSGVGAEAALSFTAQLLHEAQRQGEPVAWVQGQGSLFYPPDLAAVGVDLRALPVIRPGTPAAPDALGKAVVHLVRSGAFGLVVIDLAGPTATGDEAERLARAALPAPLQSRLERTAALHGTCVLCLTRKPAESGSLGPLVSWRGEARRKGAVAELVALKDKRGAPGWRFTRPFEPVAGLG